LDRFSMMAWGHPPGAPGVTDSKPTPPEALQSLLEVDRLVHEPARLAILTVLAAAEEVQFTFLEQVLGLTRGNLSSHVSKLEEAGYLTVTKAFEARTPVTRYQITARGRKALEEYRGQMLRSLGRG
jgi:DNA-binding transcriptional ArsR family regulator